MIVERESLGSRERDRGPAARTPSGGDDDGGIKPELHESVLEIATKPCPDTREAGAELRGLRRQVAEIAERRDLAIGSAGTHPFALLGGPADLRPPALPRPDRRAALRRAPGGHLRAPRARRASTTPTRPSTSPTACACTCRCCSRCRPTRRSGAARRPASPRRGCRSSASSRASACRPPTTTGRTSSERIGFMVDSKTIEDYTYLWYDVRPHPNFGTVEIRAMDAQTRVEHTLGLAALIQAMVKELAEHYEAGEKLAELPVRDARREPLDRRAPRARRRDGRSPGFERVPTKALARRLYDRLASTRRTSARPPSSRGSRTCSSAATARTGSRSSTRPTTTSTRSCARSRKRPSRSSGRRRLGGVASGPELFVVCKKCNSEVSPYITECPYCGTRLRKRAPEAREGRRPARLAPARAAEAQPPEAGRDPRRPRRPAALRDDPARPRLDPRHAVLPGPRPQRLLDGWAGSSAGPRSRRSPASALTNSSSRAR